MLQQRYGASPHWPVLAQALDPMPDTFATGRTAAVAETSTRVLLDLLGWKGTILTSSQLPSRPGRSQRLADLAAVTGARAYLCGTAAWPISMRPRSSPGTSPWRRSGRR